jgi:hypothetical protein
VRRSDALVGGDAVFASAADAREERPSTEVDEIARAGELDRDECGFGRAEERSDAPAVAIAQTACPVATPAAVASPLGLLPTAAFRTVRAVSGPGATMTSADTPRNAAITIAAGSPTVPRSRSARERGRPFSRCRRCRAPQRARGRGGSGVNPTSPSTLPARPE